MRRARGFLLFLASLAWLGACGGPTVLGQLGSTTGSGGSSTSSAGGGPSTGTTTGTITTTNPPAPNPECAQGKDTFAFTLTTFQGQTLACDGGPAGAGDLMLQGAVTALGNNDFSIDGCGPVAGCTGQISKLHVEAPGFAVVIPDGSFVEIEAHVEMGSACRQRLMLTNVPTWAGVAGPVAESLVFLAGNDGFRYPFKDAPFGVTYQPLGCSGPPDITLASPDVFALQLGSVAMPADGAFVLQGGNVVWSPGGINGEVFTVHNLRAYQTAGSGEAGFGWWLAFGGWLD